MKHPFLIKRLVFLLAFNFLLLSGLALFVILPKAYAACGQVNVWAEPGKNVCGDTNKANWVISAVDCNTGFGVNSSTFNVSCNNPNYCGTSSQTCDGNGWNNNSYYVNKCTSCYHAYNAHVENPDYNPMPSYWYILNTGCEGQPTVYHFDFQMEKKPVTPVPTPVPGSCGGNCGYYGAMGPNLPVNWNKIHYYVEMRCTAGFGCNNNWNQWSGSDCNGWPKGSCPPYDTTDTSIDVLVGDSDLGYSYQYKVGIIVRDPADPTNTSKFALKPWKSATSFSKNCSGNTCTRTLSWQSANYIANLYCPGTWNSACTGVTNSCNSLYNGTSNQYTFTGLPTGTSPDLWVNVKDMENSGTTWIVDLKGNQGPTGSCIAPTPIPTPTSPPPKPTVTPPIPTPTPSSAITIRGKYRDFSGYYDLTRGDGTFMQNLQVKISGASSGSTTLPSTSASWSFANITPGYYTVEAVNIPRYEISYTYCKNDGTKDGIPNCLMPEKGNSNKFIISSSVAGDYFDVYFRYKLPSCLTFTPTDSQPPPWPQNPRGYGDVDGDGDVDRQDLAMSVNPGDALTGDARIAADVTGNKSVNISDTMSFVAFIDNATSLPVCNCLKSAPGIPTLLAPTDGQAVPRATTLSWNESTNWGENCGLPNHYFDVYLDTASSPTTRVATGLINPLLYYTGNLAYSTTYYWKINQCNGFTCTSSAPWSFTTEDETPTSDSYYQAINNDIAAQGAITNNEPDLNTHTSNYLIFGGGNISGNVTSEKSWLLYPYSANKTYSINTALGSSTTEHWTSYDDLWNNFGKGKFPINFLYPNEPVNYYQTLTMQSTWWTESSPPKDFSAQNGAIPGAQAFPWILHSTNGEIPTEHFAGDSCWGANFNDFDCGHNQCYRLDNCRTNGGVYRLTGNGTPYYFFKGSPYWTNDHWVYDDGRDYELTRKPAIVFIDTSLIFNYDFKNGDDWQLFGHEGFNPSDKNGVVFIVKGDVIVYPSVTKIDAVIITEGKFYSSATYEKRAGDLDYKIYSSSPNPTPLAVKGSVLANGGFKLDRTTGTTGAAETFQFDPKYYWLFKDMMTANKYFWKEIPG